MKVSKLDAHVEAVLMQADQEPHVEAVILGDTRYLERWGGRPRAAGIRGVPGQLRTVRAWSNVKRGDTHPIDYVALGSHVNYFERTSPPTQFLRCVYKNLAALESSAPCRRGTKRHDRSHGTAHKLELGTSQGSAQGRFRPRAIAGIPSSSRAWRSAVVRTALRTRASFTND